MAAGRQRAFDEETALDNAMDVFWQKGYVATSLVDLTQAMGINKPSMYATFGNKEALYLKARQHYLNKVAKANLEYLYSDKPLKERIRDYFYQSLNNQCPTGNPRGCFVATGIAESISGELPPSVANTIVENRDLLEIKLTEFLDAEQKAGNLSKTASPKHLACFMVTVLYGSSGLMRGGKSKEELEGNIEFVLQLVETNQS